MALSPCPHHRNESHDGAGDHPVVWVCGMGIWYVVWEQLYLVLSGGREHQRGLFLLWKWLV